MDPPDDILNSDLNFLRHAPSEVRDAFAGMPYRILLAESQAIFRFLGLGWDRSLSGYWLPVETFHYLYRKARTSGDPWPGWSINASANKLLPPARPTLFCRATLLRRAYGFRGCVKLPGIHQAPDLHSMVTCGRIWIPNLSEDDVLIRFYSMSDPPSFNPD